MFGLVLGCSGDDTKGLGADTSTEVGPGGGGGGGGDADTDTDSDSDSDTDPGTDTTVTTPTWHLTGEVVVDAQHQHWGGEISVGLVDIEWTGSISNTDYNLTWKRHTVGSALPATFDFGMPDVPPANYLLEDPLYPGVLIARFLPVAWVEKTGDGEPGPADDLMATSLNHLVYYEGTMPTALTDAGFDVGWNFLEIGLDSSQVVTHLTGDHAVTVAGNLLPKATGNGLHVVVSPAFDAPPAGELRLDVFSLNAVAFGYPVAVATLVSLPLTAGIADQKIDFTLPDPPADHFIPETFTSTSVAQYQVIAYIDTDSDSSWETGIDVRLASSSADLHFGMFKFTSLNAWLFAPQFDGAGWTQFANATGGGVDLIPFDAPVIVDDL